MATTSDHARLPPDRASAEGRFVVREVDAPYRIWGDHPELPQELPHLAWLELATEAGQEYWAAMELMGRYAAANHQLIHASMARALGVDVLLDIENHHNFAWRERHRLPDGSEAEVIVHRKGATPAWSRWPRVGSRPKIERRRGPRQVQPQE
jgi:RNA-splicing ligase RtcB